MLFRAIYWACMVAVGIALLPVLMLAGIWLGAIRVFRFAELHAIYGGNATGRDKDRWQSS